MVCSSTNTVRATASVYKLLNVCTLYIVQVVISFLNFIDFLAYILNQNYLPEAVAENVNNYLKTQIYILDAKFIDCIAHGTVKK